LGDAARLQQVIWNLLSNAVKFTPKGGRVQVSLKRVNSHVEIRVSDNGEGISPEFLPFVFDRFRQQDPGTARRFGGLGLGLSIVKHLVELHGGHVQAFSDGEGRGASFVVNLPIRIMHAELFEGAPAAANSPRLDLGDGFSLRGIRVLVVDDEEDSRELLKRLLQQYGAEVETAASVEEALATFRHRPPDVLLSDIGMPGHDGFELARTIRQLSEEQGGRVPAAAVTAFAGSEDRKRVMLAGFQAHVTKPVDPAELALVIAALAGRTGGPVAP
jgi:CheY-like chemotaxis protein